MIKFDIEKVGRLLKEKGSSFHKMEVALGFGNGSATKWKNGSQPYIDRAMMIANFLGVKLEELLIIED